MELIMSSKIRVHLGRTQH